MSTKTKIWIGLGAAVLVGGGSTTAPAAPPIPSDGPAFGGSGPALSPAAHDVPTQLAAKQGGEGGEAGAALGRDDDAYLTRLGLVRGHLQVGVELYRAGARAAAMTHMKHPGDELYADLEPAFAARGVAGFAPELTALGGLVEAGAPVAEVEAAHRKLVAAVGRAAPDAGTATTFKAIVGLVRTAAEEYGIAVKDGKVVNAHEYQDALGFVRVAGELLDTVETAGRPAVAEAVAAARAQLAALAPAWPALLPPERVDTKASLLYGAAARIEIAALEIE